jgi:pimeloyl-ACP methyl ester carboxylesterase
VGRHEFFVREAGDPGNPPLLLLHGWVYDSLITWHRVVPELAADRRLVLLDLRNHGKSDRVRAPVSVDGLADDVAGVLDAVGIGTVSVVGYSLGGMVAQALARRHPGRVDRLVLAATAARAVPLPPAWAGAIFAAGRMLARIDPLTGPRLMHRYLLGVGAVPPEQAAWLWEVLCDRDVDLYFAAASAIAHFDSREWIGALDVPVCCVIPTRDQLIPARVQRATAARVPAARLVEIAGARHEAVLTHAGEVAAAIASFLSEPAEAAAS